MNNLTRCLENLINGNLTTAKAQAKRLNPLAILTEAETMMTPGKARAAVRYLKPVKGEERERLFQAYCDAK